MEPANTTEPGFSKVDVKGVLESSSSFGIDIFRKLLARYDADHIFLTETTNLIKSMAADYPEIVSLQSIGQSWEQRDINMLKIDGYQYMSKYLAARKSQGQKVSLAEKPDSGSHAKDEVADASFVQVD